MFCIHGLTREDRTKSKDGDERKRTMGGDGGEMSRQVGRCAGRNGGFWIKHGSANGVGTDTWQNCKTIFTRWQTDKRGRGGEDDNEDDLELLGGAGSQSGCLSLCQANARVNKQPFSPRWHTLNGGWATGREEENRGQTFERDPGPVYAGAPHNSTNMF